MYVFTDQRNVCFVNIAVASSSIDLDSMLDEENNTSDEDISVTDARAIRKQLEGLQNMYVEVLEVNKN